ncbi:uncharacterized protein LOC110689532 [Chenopodium quinoa]|uniref:uncharacterized protein LOC110689532 n=1 Tax=Chenopodium quinoa TaxID=63459 RepID=UPI000B76D324|nr:uncharacterized protein LOC110689532 [Chenopodium quinoa]
MRVNQRHIRSDGLCKICCCEGESIIHAIFLCSKVRGIWDFSPFAELLGDAPSVSFSERLLWFHLKVNHDDFLLFVSLAWAAWAYRNSIVFEEPWQSREVGVLGFVKLVHDYSEHMKAVSCVSNRAGGVSRGSWVLPDAGVVRINTDAAVFEGWGVGLATVIRDCHGVILDVIVRRLQAQMQVAMAEALAARMGVYLARRLGWDRGGA